MLAVCILYDGYGQYKIKVVVVARTCMGISIFFFSDSSVSHELLAPKMSLCVSPPSNTSRIPNLHQYNDCQGLLLVE